MRVSNLSEPQSQRLREIRLAADGKRLEKLTLNRADVELLCTRLNDLEFEEYAQAEELLKWTLGRLREDRDNQRAFLVDCIEQARIAELCLMEADRAVTRVEEMLAGDLFIAGDGINARWDAVLRDVRARGLLGEDAAYQEEGSAGTAEPEPPPPEPRPPASAPAPPPPASTLTEKQDRLFRVIAARADAEWKVRLSQGALAHLSELSKGALWAHIEALEAKDHIRVLDRGDSKNPATYFVCEAVRPNRAGPPKSDAELIAEALAAGKVTVCPAPGAGVH